MKVFPVDSVVESLGADGLPIYDRPYDAQDLRNVCKEFFTNGVFLNSKDSLQVTSTGGLNVKVAAGSCLISGAFGIENQVTMFEIAQGGDNSRKDAIVARLDLSMEARSITINYKKGEDRTFAPDPVLTRNETVYELELGRIIVPAGATSITNADIIDTRTLTDRCGIVTPFAELDTTTLFNQLKAATDDAVDAMNNAIDGTTAGELKRFKKSLRFDYTIPANTDLNTLTNAGTYGTNNPKNTATHINKPADLTNAYYLFVHVRADTFSQEIVDAVTGTRYYRNGTGEWNKTIDTTQTLGVTSGGTGHAALASNAVLTGNGLNPINTVQAQSGALYSTGENAAPKFGTLPISQGGTGATSGAAAINSLGMKKWLLDNVFKVGYVWTSYTNTSPSALIGGTWTPITGRFPYYNAGSSTGGSNTQTLTAAQMPSHTHAIKMKRSATESYNVGFWRSNASYGTQWSIVTQDDGSAGRDAQLVADNAGGGQAHNNMPAYQTLYAWRRTA